MDLDIAADQHTGGAVRGAGRVVVTAVRRDAESVRSPGLAAVIDIDGEVFGGRAGRPDDRGRPAESGVQTLGRSGWARGARADDQAVIG